MQNSDDKWAASWIWYPGAQRIVNFHFFARKGFVIEGRVISQALLRISVYTDYKLFINGKFIGRGPTPCDPWYQSYDTYDVKKYLKKGKNVIGVICHNYGIGSYPIIVAYDAYYIFALLKIFFYIIGIIGLIPWVAGSRTTSNKFTIYK